MSARGSAVGIGMILTADRATKSRAWLERHFLKPWLATAQQVHSSNAYLWQNCVHCRAFCSSAPGIVLPQITA